MLEYDTLLSLSLTYKKFLTLLRDDHFGCSGTLPKSYLFRIPIILT